jgi:hypothetical protein
MIERNVPCRQLGDGWVTIDHGTERSEAHAKRAHSFTNFCNNNQDNNAGFVQITTCRQYCKVRNREEDKKVKWILFVFGHAVPGGPRGGRWVG